MGRIQLAIRSARNCRWNLLWTGMAGEAPDHGIRDYTHHRGCDLGNLAEIRRALLASGR